MYQQNKGDYMLFRVVVTKKINICFSIMEKVEKFVTVMWVLLHHC